MYQNLKIEMDKRGISNRQLASIINVHENTIGYKISGNGAFTIEEAFRIKEVLFPNLELSYLFRRIQQAS